MKEKIANLKIDKLDMFSYQERVIKEVVKRDDEYTKQVIKDYFIKKYPKENIKFDFLDEEIVDEIIKLGIAEYKKRQALGGVIVEENSIEDKENSIEDIKNIEEIIELSKEEIDAKDENITAILDIEDLISLEHILSDYKRVLKESELLRQQNILYKNNIRELKEVKNNE